MKNSEWMGGKYGIMVHYLPEIYPKNGEKETDFNKMVDRFDVVRFVEQIEQLGASWLIFPFGQNSGYYCSPNSQMEKYMPGRCTKRDLMMEIAQELHKKNLRLIGYIPSEMDSQAEDMREAFGWDLSSDKAVFMERYTEVIRQYSLKLGNLLDGWWFDGCYNASEKFFARTQDWNNHRFKTEWFEALKAGNSRRISAMNPGANLMKFVFEQEEYLSGEANDLTLFPWNYKSIEKQWHALLYLDCFWIHNKKGEIEPPRFSNEELLDYLAKCLQARGAVTLNIGIYEEGIMAEKTVQQVNWIKNQLNANM